MRAHALRCRPLSSLGLSLVGAASPASPLMAVSPAGTRPSQLSRPSISARDWEPGGMSRLSAEDLVQEFITSSMPSQFPFTVLFQTGSLKFLSELHGQSSVRLGRPSWNEEGLGLWARMRRGGRRTDGHGDSSS